MTNQCLKCSTGYGPCSCPKWPAMTNAEVSDLVHGRTDLRKAVARETAAHQLINAHFGGSDNLKGTDLDCSHPLPRRVAALLARLTPDRT